MTIFDVVAFKMVTALASSTAAVTAADWSAVVDAMTGQISVSRASIILSFRFCVPYV